MKRIIPKKKLNKEDIKKIIDSCEKYLDKVDDYNYKVACIEGESEIFQTIMEILYSDKIWNYVDFKVSEGLK